jgi:hypothetical protein
MTQNKDTIFLNNLNHSIYKSIIIPAQQKPVYSIKYISDALFDKDPSDIEYLVLGESNTSILSQITVYDEFGNTLFYRDSVKSIFTPEYTEYGGFIRHTPSGLKMILIHELGKEQYVYSLPGVLPCNSCSNGIFTGIMPGDEKLYKRAEIQSPHPNPTTNTTKINYKLPDGINQGEMVFYNLQGKEVKRFKVDKTFDHLLISTTDLAAGTYYYQLQAASHASEGKKLVVIK